MPRIRAKNLEGHHDAVWMALADGLERLLAEWPYDQIAIADIAAAAGIARNTFYNYAPDKATLVAMAAARAAQSLLDEVIAVSQEGEAPPRRLERILRAICSWFGKADHQRLVHCALFGAVGHSGQSIAVAPLAGINAPVASVVAEGVAGGDFRPVFDVAMAVEILAGAVQAGVVRLVDDPVNRKAIIDEVVRFSFLGLGSDLPR